MGKGLSKQQTDIIKILSSMYGSKYYWEFLPTVKQTLYPGLWESARWNKNGARVKKYGSDMLKKNTARASMARAITRLEKRGLLKMIAPRGSYKLMKIYLTPYGKIMAKGVFKHQ